MLHFKKSSSSYLTHFISQMIAKRSSVCKSCICKLWNNFDNIPQHKIVKTLNIFPFTLHDIIKRFRDLQAHRWNCIKTGMILLRKSLSVNMVDQATHTCRLKPMQRRGARCSHMPTLSFKLV